MLFNSYAFILLFLPLTAAGFFLVARWGKGIGAGWLALCSLFFYGWWDYRYLSLLLLSICGNYLAGHYIAHRPGTPAGKRMLTVAVVANLLLLGYYKYADFFISSANTAFTADWPLLGIILPIGISFFTFTQIAFLVDAFLGKVTEYRFVYYLLFVTYFPHLIAGPILHHKEMMPQFDEDRNYRPHAENIAIGLTIFAIGLAKKVLIADNLAVTHRRFSCRKLKIRRCSLLGVECWPIPFSSTSISPATPTWQSACPACSACACRSILTRPTRQKISSSSGAAGI